jgi:hypothetical protein
LIVTSATYRQSSKTRQELVDRDAENLLLARQSRIRLSAESIRDAALAASGLLETSIGGKSIRPPQPEGVSELTYANNGKWSPSTGPERYRRGLYIHFQRTSPYPMLMNFDEPDSSVACTRRARSNTALQALNLLNDEVFHEAAQAMAWRIEREGGSTVTDKLRHAWMLALGRAPAPAELDRMARYQDQQAGIFAQEKAQHSPWLGVSRVLLNLDEFIVRE